MVEETELIPMLKDELDMLARCAGGLSATVTSAVIKLEIITERYSGEMPEHVALSLQETLDILKSGQANYDDI